MESRYFTIPVSRKFLVEKQLEKLNRRATKLGVDNLSWTWGQISHENRHIFWQNPKFPEMQPIWVERKIQVIGIDITGPLEVSYDGWQFIATIQHMPNAGNIVRSISDEHRVPLHYRDAHSNCEHCQVNRYRKDTYIVRHEDDSFVQVGSSCIKDFLGGNSPDGLINKANFIAELISFMDGMSTGYGNNGDISRPIVEVLAHTSAVIRDHGWLSKSKASDTDGTPTAIIVEANVSDEPLKGYSLSVVTDLDNERAQNAIEWVENLSDEITDASDYLYNIRTIARSGVVDNRNMGYATSIMAAYDRHMMDQVKAKNQPSQHVGEVKKRQVFTLTLKKHLSFDGMYGSTHKFIFVDEENNVLIWNASKYQDMTEGKKYGIKGTIKKHTEYKSVLQTEITRCEVLVSY